jgi:hypothetical protein
LHEEHHCCGAGRYRCAGFAATLTGLEIIAVIPPPPAPTAGQYWIVGEAPVGAGALACWTDSGRRFLAGIDGLTTWLKDQRLWAVREAANWIIGTARAARGVIGDQQVPGARGQYRCGPVRPSRD